MDQVPGVTQADGFWWVMGGPDTDDHLGPAPHEANLEPFLKALLGHGHPFLDVGAHVGRWSIRLSPQASHVVAIEANPETARVLRQNITMNEMDKDITVIEIAAWDEETWLRLDDPNKRLRGGSTRVLPVTEQETGSVLALPLDRALADAGFGDLPFGLVKMDVEGADIHALRGMRDTLRKHRPVLFIERHDQYGYYTFPELEVVLGELGYGWQDGPEYMGAKYLICHPEGAWQPSDGG